MNPYVTYVKLFLIASVLTFFFFTGRSCERKEWTIKAQEQQIASDKLLISATTRANEIAAKLQSYAYQAEKEYRENSQVVNDLQLSNERLLADSRVRVNSTPRYRNTLPKDSKGDECKNTPTGSWLLSKEDAEVILGDARYADEIVEQLRNIQNRNEAIIQQLGETK